MSDKYKVISLPKETFDMLNGIREKDEGWKKFLITLYDYWIEGHKDGEDIESDA